MEATLLGVQSVDFVANNGNKIEGTNVYCSYADENVQGEKAAKFFLKKEIPLPKDLHLQGRVRLTFDMRGKVETISTLK